MVKRGKKAVGVARTKISRGLPTGARLTVADNSGARIVEIISVIGWHGRLRRQPAASVADMVVVACKAGTPKMRRQVLRGIIVRQRMPYRRKGGQWIRFEDNAVVITSEVGDPQGSEIRGPIAREAAERWPRIASVASIIV
ncbi:MAG: 50S ribosomal protein L14 [Promethearchaeota archaeon]